MKARDLAKIVTFYARFTPNYSRIGYTARSLGWSDGGPRDFSGQRWLVTGASQGIGRALVEAAANAGAEVVAVARSAERLAAAVNALPEAAAARITVRVQDLSLQSEVNNLLDWLAESGQSIDVLMNNVGVLFNTHEMTREGMEASFATNVLGHFQLTEGLFARSLLAVDAVIVNMSSGGLYNAPLAIEGLNTTDAARYSGKAAYAFAKRAQVALSEHWNERLQSRGGKSYVMHPGWARTPGVKKSLPVFWKLQNAILRTPAQGADTAIWLAANRPASLPDTVWFDRAPRDTHMYPHTRQARCTREELVGYLDGLSAVPA